MVTFYQIYWDEKQLSELFPFAIPYHNQELTPFFENVIIKDLVLRSTSSKIAICSWNLKNKMRTNYPPYRELTEEVLNSEYDVLSFTKQSPSHQMLAIANIWHPEFTSILGKILDKIGFKLPIEVKYPIYQNAFCAKIELYREYVRNMLIPAMWIMENDEEIKKLCWSDSNYYKLRSVPGFAERVKQFLGVDYCPLHTFLAERFFSIWLDNKNIKPDYI